MNFQQRFPVVLSTIACLLLFAPLFGLLAIASKTNGSQTDRGRIIAIDRSLLTISNAEGAASFTMTEKTSILVDGQPSLATDLETGQMARVQSTMTDGKSVAVVVDSQRTLEPPLGEGNSPR